MNGRTLLGGSFAIAVGVLTGFVLSEIKIPLEYSVLSGAVMTLGLAFFLLYFGTSRG